MKNIELSLVLIIIINSCRIILININKITSLTYLQNGIF